MSLPSERFGTDTLRLAVEHWADCFDSRKEELCRLDAQAGDGDHGLTIARGFAAARAEVRRQPETASLSELFKSIGIALMQTMGGASGPIFATLFLQAGYLSKEAEALDLPLFARILAKTCSELERLTGVRFGDKTMYDVLFRLNEEAERALADGATLGEALSRLDAAGVRAAEETKQFVARKGRARFLGERSLGFEDAGAVSASLIFRELGKAFRAAG